MRPQVCRSYAGIWYLQIALVSSRGMLDSRSLAARTFAEDHGLGLASKQACFVLSCFFGAFILISWSPAQGHRAIIENQNLPLFGEAWTQQASLVGLAAKGAHTLLRMPADTAVPPASSRGGEQRRPHRRGLGRKQLGALEQRHTKRDVGAAQSDWRASRPTTGRCWTSTC